MSWNYLVGAFIIVTPKEPKSCESLKCSAGDRQDPCMVIAAPDDVLAPNSARTSAGTAMAAQKHSVVFASKSIGYCWCEVAFCWSEYIFQNCQNRLMGFSISRAKLTHCKQNTKWYMWMIFFYENVFFNVWPYLRWSQLKSVIWMQLCLLEFLCISKHAFDWRMS